MTTLRRLLCLNSEFNCQSQEGGGEERRQDLQGLVLLEGLAWKGMAFIICK